MITQTRFFGLPLTTHLQRRALVIGYYAVVGSCIGLVLLSGHSNISFLLPQTLILGGIRPGGP